MKHIMLLIIILSIIIVGISQLEANWVVKICLICCSSASQQWRLFWWMLELCVIFIVHFSRVHLHSILIAHSYHCHLSAKRECFERTSKRWLVTSQQNQQSSGGKIYWKCHKNKLHMSHYTESGKIVLYFSFFFRSFFFSSSYDVPSISAFCVVPKMYTHVCGKLDNDPDNNNNPNMQKKFCWQRINVGTCEIKEKVEKTVSSGKKQQVIEKQNKN